MPKMKIDLSEVRDASKKASDIASALDKYADSLSKKVMSPASSLTGGSNYNSSAIVTQATQKMSDLRRRRATAYRNLSRDLSTFAQHAEDADGRVEVELKGIRNIYFEKLNIFQKGLVYLNEMWNSITGGSRFGHAINQAYRYLRTVAQAARDGLKQVYRWFKYGNGRYVLNIVGKVVGLITTIWAVVGAAVALAMATAPAAIVIGIIAVVSGVVFAIYKCVTTFATVSDNVKALGAYETDPGLARYQGTGSTLQDYAKRNSTSQKFQSTMAGVDAAGTTAGVIFKVATILQGGFESTNAAGDKVYGTFTWKNLMNKQVGKYGLKCGEEGSWSFDGSKLINNFTGKRTADSNMPNWYNTVDNISSRMDRTLGYWESYNTITARDSGTKDYIKAGGKIIGGPIKDVINLSNDVGDIASKHIPAAKKYSAMHSMSNSSVSPTVLTNSLRSGASLPAATLRSAAMGSLSSASCTTGLPGGVYTAWPSCGVNLSRASVQARCNIMGDSNIGTLQSITQKANGACVASGAVKSMTLRQVSRPTVITWANAMGSSSVGGR